MSKKKEERKVKKEKAKLYNAVRRVWSINPITRIKRNKKKDYKPNFED